MEQKDKIQGLIQKLYPPKDEKSEPELAIFRDGTVYTSNPDFWDKPREEFSALGGTFQSSVSAWREANQPNLLWLRDNTHIFVPRDIRPNLKVRVIDEAGEEYDIHFTKMNLALFIYFINHGLSIEQADLKTAKGEIQDIYYQLGKDGSKQLMAREDDWTDRKNDWFSKLVNDFNEWPKDENHAYSHIFFGIKIDTRKAMTASDLPNEHDYQLYIPFKIIDRDDTSFDAFLNELKKRRPDIEKEKNLVSPIKQWELTNIDRAFNNGFVGTLAKLGESFEERKQREPSEFEKWYKNDNLLRIIVSYDTKKCCSLQNGESHKLDIPARHLAVLLLFAYKLPSGISLNQLRENHDLYSELNHIYFRIKHSDKKSINLETGDSTHPNQKLMQSISLLKHKGFVIKCEDSNSDVYRLEGVHEILEL